uniref:non-specific serine/threonine protein kinase n=1 Tax=Oryzias melastigma TaxID=30732 RepID=A0A3B3BF04_ORYME
MGNQLAGIAPSQILSVDSYFSDILDHEYDKSLGSTRFFKVARAKHREGLVVVKVFAIQDPSLPLTSYKQELEELKIRLHSCQNCLPFQKATLTEKAAILFRQYVRDNLYDRISTRPFLNNVEKRWLAFQILSAVDQAHKAGVRHGDIKTENVMVTSWNWVLLSDFASFKPTFLPEDNPADFNYFFDTSRRRTCYIAPERFVDGSMFTTESDQNTPLVDLTNNNQRSRGELKQAMDIFSACVIAELFTEGVPLFDLSQLLAYRKGLFQTEQVLQKIEDPSIRELPREEQGLLVLVSVITSCLQTLHSCDSKLAALELVLHLGPRLSVDILLDRITPYLLHFCNDHVPRVRAQAIRTLTKVLALVKEVPRNDINIYPEYVLPGVAHLAQDDATIVRLAYANIAHLAESALRFLELVQENNVNSEQDVSGEDGEENNHPSDNYDSLQALHEMVQQKVVTLLSDPENIVKQSLMESGITRLCVFFGRQKANDVLLSHMITFLNDKNDWHLRGAFFDSIVVAAYVGWQSSSILKPLLQQGLSDTEEFVIYKALNALTAMCQLGLLQKPHIYEFVSDIGMTEAEEDKLLALKDFMLKSNKAKANMGEQNHQGDSAQTGVIDLATLGIMGRQVDLVKPKAEAEEKKRKQTKQDSTMNEEWKSMFGSQEPPPSQPPAAYQRRMNTCKAELQQLVQQKREQCSAERMAKKMMESAEWESRPPPPWHPKGLLVAHLHEHKAAVNRIRVSDEHAIFATASNDGTVKVWDSQKMEGKTTTTSVLTYARVGGHVKTLTFCQGSHYLAVASDSGSIQLLAVEANKPPKSPKVQPYQTFRTLDLQEDGCAVDVHHFNSGTQSVLAYATVNGSLVGWDLRSNTNAWTLRHDLRLGLITSFCVDMHQCWLCLTSSGTMACWDMRFQLPISNHSHPARARVRRLLMHPLYQSSVIAVQGNNEVSMWDLETGDRKFTLWASSAPPLSEMQLQPSPHSVHGIYCSPADGNPLLLTAGSDMRIRFWDLAYPERSYIVAGGANDSLHCPSVFYSRKIIEGTEVVQEIHSKQKSGAAEDSPRRGPESLPVGHHDIITDIATFQTTQGFIVTSSRDGIVKVWK